MKDCIRSLTLLIICTIFSTAGIAAPANSDATIFTQPDGANFVGFTRGDEHQSWYETSGGYTFARKQIKVLDEQRFGSWFYVTSFEFDGTPVLSNTQADFDPPEGLKQSIRPPRQSNQISLAPQANVTQTQNAPSTGEPFSGKLLFILAEFDNKRGSTSEASWANLLNKTIDYFDTASYGAVSFSPANESAGINNNGVVGWVNVGPTHINRDPSQPRDIPTQQLVADAINAADPFVDYAQYDLNADGHISSNELSVVVIVAGGELATRTPGPGVWGHAWCLFLVSPPVVDNVSVSSCRQGDGYTVLGYSQFGEKQNDHIATMGIIVHELGHSVFGLPDLYDIDSSSGGIDIFGVMSSGVWGRSSSDSYSGETPVLPSAWTKYKMGWVEPMAGFGIKNFTATGSSSANGSNTTYMSTKTNGESFLIENRQQIGYDAGLARFDLGNPFCGLAIYHIDDSKTSNAADNDRLVDVEEADGTEGTYPYQSDLFFAGNKTEFNDFTQPSARFKNGSFSNMGVTGISNCIIGNPMSAELFSTDADAPTAVITTPSASASPLPSSFTVSGTASDTGGSGFDAIRVAIRTTGTGNNMWYDFNGGFAADIVRMDANLNNTSVDYTDWDLPVDLPAGNYFVQILAIDTAGNNSGWVRQNFEVALVDNDKPTGVISNPDSSGLPQPSTFDISGTASDTGGSGFDAVQVAIRTTGTSNNMWYDFNGGFADSIIRKDADLSNTTTDSTNWSLPVDLPEGTYFVQILVFDNASNNSGWIRQTFEVATPDTANPTGVITTPSSSGSPLPTSFTISGTASDIGNSGLDNVEVAIRTTGTNNNLWYDFNGGFKSSIVRTNANLSNTTLDSTDWNLPISLPAGNYFVQILVFDGARNNSGWVRQTFEVSESDTDNPTGAITTPGSSGLSLPTNFSISGTASDTGNSGLDKVEVAIRTTGSSTNLWYDFNGGFTGSIVRTEATLSNTGQNSANWSLPVNLPAGNYFVQILVFDGAHNNSGWIRKTFEVAAPDNENPTGVIESPDSSGSPLPTSFTISGTASDAGDSGLNSVSIAIRTTGTSNNMWYDFNGGFASNIVRTNATLSNTTTNSTDWSLPVNLPVGKYFVQILVSDEARNFSGWIRQNFEVTGTNN